VAWTEAYLRTKWHLDPFSRLAAIHQRFKQTDRQDRTDNASIAYTANRFTNGRPKKSQCKLHEILCGPVLSESVAPSTSSDSGTRHVLPVLWMTSCFPLISPMACVIGNLYVSTVLQQVVINFQRIPRWRHTASLWRPTQWQSTAHRRRSQLSTIGLCGTLNAH